MGAVGRFMRKGLTVGVFILCIAATASEGADNYPSCSWGCNAKDAEIVKVWAEVSGGSCVTGDPTTITVYVIFSNHMGKTVYALRLLADLYVDGSLVEHFDECLGDVPPGESSFVAGFSNVTCSTHMELRNTVLSYAVTTESCADTPKCAARATHCWAGAGSNKSVPIVNAFLSVGFTAPASVCLGATPSFTDQTSGGKTPYRYLWDFGDGSTSTVASPSHKYTAPGDYAVSLTVTDANGTTNTARHDLIVIEPPAAEADNGGPYCPGQTIALYADGGVSYRWTGPSSFSSSLQNPTIPRASAANAGTYTVTVTDASSCVSQASTVVSLDATPPTLSLPPDATVECDEAFDPSVTGEAVAFDNEDPPPNVSYTDLITSGSCGSANRVQRTWSAVDACGNRVTGVQIINLIDTTPPTLRVSDATFECDGSGNAGDIATWLASARASDACGPVTVTNDFDRVSARCSGTGTATVTFTATDACGNATEARATLKIVDSVAPDAVDDLTSTSEDNFVLVNVLGNDSDRCQGGLTIVSVTTPTFGDATIGGDAIEYTPSADAHGVAEFRYTIEDCVGHRDVAWVRVTVTPVNDAPVAVDQAAMLNEGTSAALELTGTDADHDALTFAIGSGPQNGTLTELNPTTGAVTYTPDQAYNGPDSFTFTICDPSGSCDEGTVTLTVRPVNDAPVAFDETEVLSQNQLLSIQLSAADSEGDTLTYAILAGPTNGTLVGFDPTTGAVTYVPDQDYSGPDSFTFTVCDPSRACDTATVALTVVYFDDMVTAVDQSAELDEDTSVVVQLVGTDVDGDMLPATVLAGPQHGTLVGYDPTTGSVTYVPDPDYAGPDSFTFTACDERGVCDEGIVSLTVHPVNDPPRAVDPTDVLSEDGSLTLVLAGTDADGDALTYTILTGPTHGTLVGFAPTTGTLTYVPDPNYNGSDSFTFTVCDPSGACDTGTAALAVTPVNDPPVAIGMAGTLNEDTSLLLQLEGTDVDGDVLAFSIVAGPAHGTLVGFDPATGAVTYVPDPNYSGPDSFTFTVCGPTGACDTATIALTVSPVNDPPEASPQDVWTREDVSLGIHLSASDVDGDSISYRIVIGPTHGTLLGLNPATGALMYVPDGNYNGLDSLTFSACDPAGACDTAVVAIEVVAVDDPPAAVDQTLVLDEDQTLAIELAGSDVDEDAVTFAILVPPEHGTLVGFDPDSGAVTYVPDPHYDGTDMFRFSVCDPAGACDAGTVSFVVRPVNGAPLAGDDQVTVSDDAPNPILLTGTDPDDDPLVYRLVSGPTHGTISGFDPVSGELTYTADPGYSGADSFMFEVCDPSGACDEGTIELLVVAVAHAPVSETQILSTPEDTPLDILLRAADPDGDAITYSIPGPPAHGRIESINPTTGGVVYVPDTGFDGNDQFVFRACDPSGACSAAVVTVIVLPVNEAPIVTSFETTVTAGVSVDLQLIAQDPEGASISFTIVGGPSHGTIGSFDPATGAFTYLPAEGYAGLDQIVFRACDSSGLCAEGVIQTLAVLVAGGGGALAGCQQQMIISEIAWAGTAVDPRHEWIELRNVESEEIDLTGWTVRWRPIVPAAALDGFWRVIGLSGSAGAFSGVPSVGVATVDGRWFRIDVNAGPDQDIVLLERATDDAVRDVVATQVYADELALGRLLDLPDAGALMELVDPYGCVVDRVMALAGRGAGWPGGNAIPPASMQRDQDFVEAGSAEWSTNWGPFISGHDKAGNIILGTPGTVNPPPMGEILSLLPAEGARAILIGTVLAVALPGDPSAWMTGPAMVCLTDRVRGRLAIPASELLVETSVVDGASTLVVETSNLPTGDYALWVRSAAGMVYAVLLTVLP
ncbi:MAG: Ig-like domain-containing protein [Thermotogota bacterium]